MFKRLLLLTSLILAGCNVYHPLTGGVGYTDVPIGPNSYEVTFTGDADMPVGEARWYCLVRSAELAVLRNDPYFEILDQQVYLDYGSYYYPGNYGAVYYGRGRHAYWGYGYDPGYVQPYALPEVTIRVGISREPGPETIPAGYLISEAAKRKVPLTPGVSERAATMPSQPVPLPPPPPPMFKSGGVPVPPPGPAPATQSE
ncbi:MAG TPA: hypothetical protein VM008_06460 [Phycisphaerae bacterium]|nr:hypothetical protein [Phycisphaerae bacterium]